MATVTRQFKDNFDAWAKNRISRGQFSEAEMDDFKAMIRKDLQPGPDQLRQGLEIIKSAGVAVPATIDDHEERYRLWDGYFAEECKAIGAAA